MSDYYDFTNEERVKGGRIQTWAYKQGHLVRPHNCSACNIFGDVPGQIIAHLEDYTEPIKGAIFLCYRCHTMVHQRFNYPGPWKDYIKAVADGYKWPLARAKSQILQENCNAHFDNDIFALSKRNPKRDRTVLNDIEEGLLFPGKREVWAEKMAQIMEGKRVYWIPSSQMMLI